MRLKRKTVRRLLLLSLVMFLCAGAGVAVFVVRKARNESRLVTRRAAGMEAAAAGQHRRAVEQLGGFLKERRDDPEALLAYARARRHVEERDGRQHLVESSTVFQRYLTLRRDDAAARRELLQVLLEAGLDVEACDVARQLRPADPAQLAPEHLDVVRTELRVRQSRRLLDDETIALARRVGELAPADFGDRIRYATILIAAGRQADAAAFVEQTAEQFPDDPRVTLLRFATGAAPAAGVQDSEQLLARIAGLDPRTGARVGEPLDPSEIVLAMLVSGFDAVGRPDLALAAIEPRARSRDVGYVRPFARRALYSGNNERLLDVAAAQSGDTAWNVTDVLALVGLAAASAGKPDQAAAIFDRIKAAPADFRTASWALVRSALLERTGITPAEAVKAFRAAIAENPNEPIFREKLAELLLELGRPGDARAELDVALRSPLADGWAKPRVLRARTFLVENRLVEAQRECRDAVRRFRADPLASATLLAIRAEMLDRGYGDAEEAKQVAGRLGAKLADLEAPSAATYPPDMLASLISAIAVAGDKANDLDTTRRALTLASKADASFTAPALARLVEISRRRELKLEDAILAKAERNGATPASVLIRAIGMHADARTSDAIALARRESEAHAQPADSAWRALVPTLLDAADHPDAAAEWRAALDRFPDDAGVHTLAMQSRAVGRDPDLLLRVVDRLDEFAGTRGQQAPISVRLARARVIAAKGEPAEREKLIGTLRALVAEAPDLVEPRLMLADALTAPGAAPTVAAVGEAVEQLRATLAQSPASAPIRLRIAEILRRAGNYDAASTELAAVAADPQSSADARWAAVEGLSSIGRFEQAAALARAAGGPGGADSGEGPTPADPARALSMARILVLANRRDDARAIYQQLAGRTSGITPEQAFDIADGLTSTGNPDAARAMLDRLAAMPENARDTQRVRARLALASGRADEARAILLQLTSEDPKDVRSWRVLIESSLNNSMFAEARQSLAAARTGAPDDPDLQLLALQIDFREGRGSVNSLATVADALDRLPQMRERARAVRAYAAIRAEGRVPTPADLRDLAFRFPDEPTLQSVIIGDLLAISPPALSIASEVGLQAARRFPSQWQASADAVRVFRLTGQWPAVLEFAERWRRLNPTRESDLAVGEAQLRLGRLRPARAAVEPHLRSAIDRPDQSLDVLGLWGAILVAEEKAGDARDLLEPLAARSPRVFTGVWLPLAATVLPSSDAVSWLDWAVGPANAFGLDAQLAITDAWATLAARDPERRTEHLSRARDILERLIGEQSDPRVPLALAITAGELGDLDRAQTAFEIASRSPATAPVALRGLAQVSLARGDPVAAAVAARKALAAFPDGRDPATLRILSDALMAQAEREPDPAKATASAAEAANSLIAAAAVVGETPILLERLAQALERAGRADESLAAYERIVNLPDGGISPRDRAAARNNLAFALASSRADQASLERARSLARDAAAVLPVGAILDTLGMIEVKLGNRDAALEAFRRSLNDRKDSAATMSKLAELLADGTVAEKGEARQLVLAAEQVASRPDSGMTPETRARLERVRRSLTMP